MSLVFLILPWAISDFNNTVFEKKRNTFEVLCIELILIVNTVLLITEPSWV